MKMTLREYIQNPMGANSSVITQRNMYKELYNKKFGELLLRENGKFDCSLYTKGDNYLLHIKIPSEKTTTVYYDVVLEFSPPDDEAKAQPTIDNYTVKFFSNDPAFVFTYAYVFVTNDLIISDLKSKLGKIATTTPGVEKNPKNVVGYIKSFYLAYLYMKLKGLNKKVMYSSFLKKYFKTPFSMKIASFKDKLEERQKAQIEQAKHKRAEKKSRLTKTEEKKVLQNVENIVNTKLTKKVKTVATISKTRLTKRK